MSREAAPLPLPDPAPGLLLLLFPVVLVVGVAALVVPVAVVVGTLLVVMVVILEAVEELVVEGAGVTVVVGVTVMVGCSTSEVVLVLEGLFRVGDGKVEDEEGPATGGLLSPGGGVESDPPTRAPIPQGICCPSGWVSFSGGTTSPVLDAIVKRVAHCLLGDPGAVNW
jgi:hypothetical protein